jgi:hypothetical protein
MDEFDVMKIIAESLSERKLLAALSNYQVLNNNVAYVNTLFGESLFWLQELSNRVKAALEDNHSASSEARERARYYS